MDGVIGPVSAENTMLPANFLGDDLLWGIADLQGLLHRLQHRRVGKPGGEGVDGQDPAGSHRGRIQRFKDRGGHIIADEITRDRAVEDIFLAVLQLLRGVLLIKKGEGQTAAVVGHGDFGQIQTLADMGGPGGVHDHGLEAGGLVRLQLFDGYQPGAVFIASGEMADTKSTRMNGRNTESIESISAFPVLP